MARKKVLIGNWKMNNTLAQTEEFVKASDELVSLANKKGVVIGVAPTYLSLAYVASNTKGLKVFAQEVHYKQKGAYTGNVSVEMVKEVGAIGSLVGHSERRTYEKETDLDCNLRVKSLLSQGQEALLCVGETLKEYEEGLAYTVISSQIYAGLNGVKKEDMSKVTIAYEPVWSIGTGKNASEEIAQDICKFIRGLVEKLYSKEVADNITILYGGSVKPNNIHGYLTQEDVDGALVGGASLTGESFKALIENI